MRHLMANARRSGTLSENKLATDKLFVQLVSRAAGCLYQIGSKLTINAPIQIRNRITPAPRS